MLLDNFITINQKKYSFTAGETILAVCLRNEIFIPALCKHPDLEAQGKCRVCLVEVAGRGLATACSTPAENDLNIKTNTVEVKRARRTNLEMIYAEHIEKCDACIQEHNCALKKFAESYGLKLTRFQDRKGKSPLWHFGALSPQRLVQEQKEVARHFKDQKEIKFRQAQLELQGQGFVEFDSAKCIDCGICTEVCSNRQTVDFCETAGKGFNTQTKPVDNKTKDCVYCGQCIVHCPVGAIQGVPHWSAVEELLKNKKKLGKIMIGQIAPSIRTSIGEEFNLPYGEVMTGQLAGSLKKLGFDAAFDVTVGADFTTYEEARELVEWLKKVRPEDVIVVSIMPCTAKKQEISLARQRLPNGLPAVDFVLTTREYGYLLKKHQIDLAKIKPKPMDDPLGVSSGAGVIYGASGGVMESALRTAEYFLQVKKETGGWQKGIRGEKDYCRGGCGNSSLFRTRLEFKEVRGDEAVKTAIVKLAGVKLKVAVVHGLGNARKLLTAIKAKKVKYDYVEVMACPGGCIGGGGQPIPTTEEIRKKRMEALYKLDKSKKIRKSTDNKQALEILDWLREKGEKLEHSVLHTKYKRVK